MKIYLYYESNFKKDYIWLDVPEEEMTITIERDYQKRLAKAKPGEKVVRRDFQTIMNEEISKPTYNSNHKDERRRASYDKLDAHETLLCDSNISRKTTILRPGFALHCGGTGYGGMPWCADPIGAEGCAGRISAETTGIG